MSEREARPEVTERKAHEGPKKSKGLTKKRGQKPRAVAELNSQKRATHRTARHERQMYRHRDRLLAWARRNGIRDLGSHTEARDAVRAKRAMLLVKK